LFSFSFCKPSGFLFGVRLRLLFAEVSEEETKSNDKPPPKASSLPHREIPVAFASEMFRIASKGI